MKKTVVFLALASLLCLGGSAMANIGTADVVPAATLLIPRFEVDLADTVDGIDTLFSINNASDESVLAHVTFWTEWWVPILDFDVYLTGYDVQTISARDIIVNGKLPKTGTSTAFPAPGLYSGPHVTFPACSNSTGPTNYSQLTGAQRTLLQQAFSGQEIDALSGDCASQPGNPTLARGYITIDSVNNCGTDFPSNSTYFDQGGTGVANNNNVLWGDYFYVQSGEDFAQGFTAVHIEADARVSACDTDLGYPYTFYCTLTGANLEAGVDNREALASVWASRYIDFDGDGSGGTDLIVWRDPRVPGEPQSDCKNEASGQNQIVVFDEQENPFVVEDSEPSLPGEEVPIFPFPWCTNRTRMGTDIGTEEDFGWVYVNLNTGTDLVPGDNFAGGDFYNQAYLTVVMSSEGRFSVGFDGLQLNNLTGFDGRSRDPLLNTQDLPTLTAFPLDNQALP